MVFHCCEENNAENQYFVDYDNNKKYVDIRKNGYNIFH